MTTLKKRMLWPMQVSGTSDMVAAGRRSLRISEGADTAGWILAELDGDDNR